MGVSWLFQNLRSQMICFFLVRFQHIPYEGSAILRNFHTISQIFMRHHCFVDLAMGQNPVPPVNIPIPTKTGSKIGGAPTPKMGSHWF